MSHKVAAVRNDFSCVALVMERQYALKDEQTMKPMLSTYTLIDLLSDFPLLVQPKLNGVRTYWLPGQKELRTREGMPVSSCPHVIDDLVKIGLPCDGELYCHGMPLDDISSAVRKLRPSDDSMLLKLNVFDMQIAGMVEHERQKIVAGMPTCVHVRVVETLYVSSKAEARARYDDILAHGLEGMIARDPGGIYAPGRRMTWKLKPVWD